LFVLSYINIQGSLEAMNLRAQTLLCGTGNNSCSYMHFLNQWVTHTKLLNTQTKQIWCKTPKWYRCKQMLQSYIKNVTAYSENIMLLFLQVFQQLWRTFIPISMHIHKK